MMKIVFGAVRAERLGNISVNEEFRRLKNGMLDQDTVTQVAGSHETLPVIGVSCVESCLRGDKLLRQPST